MCMYQLVSTRMYCWHVYQYISRYDISRCFVDRLLCFAVAREEVLTLKMHHEYFQVKLLVQLTIRR